MANIYGLNPIDFAIVVASLIGTIVLGWKVSRGASTKAGDFLVGGRKLGWVLQFFLNFGNMADSNGAPTVAAEVYREGLGGACDLVHFNGIGASGIVLGPGNMGVAHKPDEYVPEDQLWSAVQIYRDIAVAMLKA